MPPASAPAGWLPPNMLAILLAAQAVAAAPPALSAMSENLSPLTALSSPYTNAAIAGKPAPPVARPVMATSAPLARPAVLGYSLANMRYF